MCNDNKNGEKYDGFISRLIELRESKGFSTKTEFAEWLGVSRNSYSMIETGYRPPNKKFIEQLFLKTGRPEEYWLYGINSESEFAETREEFKMLRKAIDDIIDLKLMDLEGNYTSITNEKVGKSLIDTALKADLYHILLKKKKKQGN